MNATEYAAEHLSTKAYRSLIERTLFWHRSADRAIPRSSLVLTGKPCV
jgi:hypothetical protein